MSVEAGNVSRPLALSLPVSAFSGPFMKEIMPSMAALSPFIFQLPPTKNFLWLAMVEYVQLGASAVLSGWASSAGGGRALLAAAG